MRYTGNKETVLAIETIIRRESMALITERPRNKEDVLFGQESIVKSKVFDIMMPKSAYIFPVRLFYDDRDGTAAVDIRDKDVWWLCKISPQVIKLLAMMEQETFAASSKR